MFTYTCVNCYNTFTYICISCYWEYVSNTKPRWTETCWTSLLFTQPLTHSYHATRRRQACARVLTLISVTTLKWARSLRAVYRGPRPYPSLRHYSRRDSLKSPLLSWRTFSAELSDLVRYYPLTDLQAFP